MANDPKSQSLLVVDQGLFCHVAQSLAPSFKSTSYYSEWRLSAFPESKHAAIGDGLPGIDRPLNLWHALDAADVVVFPDVVTAALADHLAVTKPVWGTTSHAAELELDRWAFRKILREVGLPVTEAVRVTGTVDLEKYLKKSENVYVKYTSRFRRDLETFHHLHWYSSEDWFADLAHRLGPLRGEAVFIVEEPVEGVEMAVDEYTVNGELPDPTMWGIEKKDSGYIGAVVERRALPEPLRDVTQRLAPILKKRAHTGWVAFEAIVDKKGNPYVTDPCLRAGSPPSEVLLEAYSNWGEIIISGVRGELVDPVPRETNVAQLILKSEAAVEHFVAVELPKGSEELVRLHNHTVIDKRHYIVPVGVPEIGAVIGIGDIPYDAQQQALDTADATEAYELDYDEAAFETLNKKWEEAT